MNRRVAAVAIGVLAACSALPLSGGPAGSASPGWSVIGTPFIPPGNYSAPFDVSCASIGNCVAVGTATNINVTHSSPLIFTESNGNWSATQTPSLASLFPTVSTGSDPAPAGASLAGVACTSVGNCVAVGDYFSASNGGEYVYSLILTESAGIWSATQQPSLAGLSPSPLGGGELDGVSCTSAGNCVAVGEYTYGSSNPLILTEVNGTWTVTQQPTSPDSGYQLQSVSCPSVGNCVAVGTSGRTGTTDVAILSESGGVWSRTPQPSLAGLSPAPFSGGPPNELNGVSCTSVGNCVAVGSYWTGNATVGQFPALILTESNGTWSAVQAPPQIFSAKGVSCTSVGNCVAVGNFILGSVGVTPILTELDGTWSATQTPPVDPGIIFQGISCPSAGNCVTIGSNFGSIGILTQSPGGDAPFYGSMGGKSLNRPIVGMASDPALGGYWEVASDGGLFAFNAAFYGSTGNIHLNQPIVGMADAPDGKGYWEVASDGGIFSFGDAVFYGSTGALRLNKPIVGMADTPDGKGYWLVASDGGIFSFGDAAFYGSTGNIHLNQPIVGMAATPDGHGYWLVAADGGIFSFGNAAFYGSTGALSLNKPIVGMAATPDGGGYWLVASDGGLFSF